ncbi:hypothetical protein AB8613_23950 [Vibrio sp. BS-M-Sm-2]|uniref:hypothetical protein n=1 Tax=Vibrio sp. BS-M-Sm-2 TaxID=3241167 RepID=UPI003558455A
MNAIQAMSYVLPASVVISRAILWLNRVLTKSKIEISLDELEVKFDKYVCAYVEDFACSQDEFFRINQIKKDWIIL